MVRARTCRKRGYIDLRQTLNAACVDVTLARRDNRARDDRKRPDVQSANQANARNRVMNQENVNRRRVLRTLGTGVAGGAVLVGTTSGSPRDNFGYVETESDLEGETVTLSGPPERRKVFCDAGGSESRIKTEAWDVGRFDESLYLIPSGYDDGDEITVGSVFTSCTKSNEIKGEVSVTKA